MSAQTPRVVPPIPPESAVSMAWGLTISYSSLEDANTRGQDILDRMAKIRKEVEALPSSDPLKEKHIKYIDAVYSSINASLRNLTSVLQGRNKDYKEIDKLMETQLEKLSSIDKVTANAQSAVPRIFATSGGLSAPFVILQFAGLSLPLAVITALGVIAAGLSYAVYQMVVLPWTKDRTQHILVDTDYRKNLYYAQYVIRSETSLISLCNQVLDAYHWVYGAKYDVKYDEQGKVRGLVRAVMGGDGVMLPNRCEYIDKHYHDGEITPELWPSCETGEGVKECPLYKREKATG